MKIAQTNDIYIDYLITQNGQATATGCSELLNAVIKHDAFSRMLAEGGYDSKYVWESNKPHIRRVENSDGMLILDNSICHKPHSQTSDIISYHYDHSEGRAVKGINLLTAIVKYEDASFPVGFEVIKKDQIGIKENKKGKEQMYCYSHYTINELARSLVQKALYNHVKFQYILGDSWFASKENILFFHQQKCKFILGIPSHRLIALSRQDAKDGNYVRLDSLELKSGSARKVYLKDILFPVVVTCKVFKEEDTIQGELYLVTNDLTLSGDCAYENYQKRWDIETYHRSLKQNVSLCKSPCYAKKTVLNHVALSLLAYSRLEQLKIFHKSNH